MPQVDPSKLTSKQPILLADSHASLSHGVGWQRQPGSAGGADFIVYKTSLVAGVKVVERYPLTERGWVSAWTGLVRRDPASARSILSRLAARKAAAVTGAVLPKAPPRFPSSPETRRRILQAIAGGNEKYARPFDKGRVALASLFGTESWADYGNVVLQMAILDTLLSIEEKLGALMGPEAQESGEDPADDDGQAV